jgi:SMC interacting uncharacterized protein involved in chromosome segregation
MVNTQCPNPHTKQLNEINNEIDKLRDEEKVLQEDRGHRLSQKNAWKSIERAYGTQYLTQLGKGKYFDFGGRKSRSATRGDVRDAQYYLNDVIPQELEKIDVQLNDINLDKHVLISKARQLVTKSVQHEVECLKEHQKKTKQKLRNSFLRLVGIGVMT